MFYAILVTADGEHFAMPNCKISKWLNADIIVTESCYNSIQTFFFSFHSLVFLKTGAILTGLFLFNFETNQWKNHFDTNLVIIKLNFVIIEILSVLSSVLF